MKTRLLILMLLLFSTACHRTVSNGPQLRLEGEDTRTGLITIHVSGSGEDDKTLFAGKNTLENIASKRAFEQLMFIGIANSTTYRVPLTPNMERSTDANPFLRNFFQTGDFRRFITDIHPISDRKTSSNYRQNIRYSVTVNGTAFRKYLEQNSQIRPFGY